MKLFVRPILRSLARIVPALALLLCLPGLCQAHGVFIFAWDDGERVCTESYFSKTNKVRQAEVIMADSSGAVLAKGRTNDNGLHCFARPEGTADLVFTVLAGPGHKGSFALRLDPPARTENGAHAAPKATGADAGQSPAAAGAVAAGAEPTPAPGNATVDPPGNAAADAPGNGLPGAHSEKTALPDEREQQLLRQMVREELRAQLEPIRLALMEESQDRTPDAARIIGGMGWLAGLGALGYWLAQKRKKP